jgi:septal ring factor EnvC (AmiA/AmiB activator)
MKKHLLTILLFTTSLSFLNAQPPASSDKGQLEKERQEIQDELKEIQSMYDKVKGQKSQSLGQLNMLKRKITLHERYINSISHELKMIDDDIYTSNLEIFRLQKQVDTLKAQYARTIVYAYKNRSSYDYVNFIFSASSFNDAIRRISYLKNYRAYREKQVNTILETQKLIAKRQQQQLTRKEEKNVALQSQTKEKTVLDEQRKEKDVVVSQLKSQEKDLQKQIAVKRKRDNDIKSAIDAIVRREIAKAAEEAKRKAAEEKKNTVVTTAPTTSTTPGTTTKPAKPEVKRSYLDLTAEDMKLNGSFEMNRGRIPWPVDNGFVSIHFGKYKIDETKLVGDNPGITIVTPNSGVSVKAVYDGEVAAVHNYGDGYAVIIRHGKYFTSYSNLSSVTTTKGAAVTRGQVIGHAAEADDGSKSGQVDFMLLIETKNVNPELWLIPRR